VQRGSSYERADADAFEELRLVALQAYKQGQYIEQRQEIGGVIGWPAVKAAALRAAAGRPLRHGLRACGVGAGPSGRADRAAHRTKATVVDAPQLCNRPRATAARDGRGPAGQLSSFAPTGRLRRLDGSPAHQITGCG
jgi:hypothetical protein